MNNYHVTFAGHRRVENFLEAEEKLERILLNLLKDKEYVEFYVSNDGGFDIMATSVIRRARKLYGEDNSTVNLVLAYKKADLELLEKQFDFVIIPEELYGVHYKRAITEKNRWLVDHSDLLICHVNKDSGGAYNTLKYATKKGIEIMNI